MVLTIYYSYSLFSTGIYFLLNLSIYVFYIDVAMNITAIGIVALIGDGMAYSVQRMCISHKHLNYINYVLTKIVVVCWATARGCITISVRNKKKKRSVIGRSRYTEMP